MSIDFFLLYSCKYFVTYLGLCLDLIYVHTNFILSITTIYMSIEMNAIIQFSISLNGIKGSHNLTFHLCIYFNKQLYLVRRFWCAKVPVASTACLPCSCPSVCRPPQSHYHSPSLFSDDLYSCCGIFFVNAHPLLSLGPTSVIQQVIVFSVYWSLSFLSSSSSSTSSPSSMASDSTFTIPHITNLVTMKLTYSKPPSLMISNLALSYWLEFFGILFMDISSITRAPLDDNWPTYCLKS